MSKQYIELDSAYRNRNEYPYPSQFVAMISQSGIRDAKHALDPVSDAYPLRMFSGSFDMNAPNITVSGAVQGGTPQSFYIIAALNSLSRETDYYQFANITDTTIAQTRTIASYKFIDVFGGQDRAHIIVASAFAGAFAVGDTIDITNESQNNNPPQIFIPRGGPRSNRYKGLYLYDETIGELKNIVEYDGLTGMATLDSPFSGAWNVLDLYSIRKARSIFGISQGTIAPFVAPQNSGLEDRPGAPTSNTIHLDTTAAFDNDTYNGYYIRIITGPAAGDIRRIINYWGVNPNGTGGFDERKVAQVSPAFSAVPSAIGGDQYELYPFARDNAVPFCWSGSTVSQQQMVCYEIQLVNLLLPNLVLSTGYGGRISFHPYVYVEFANESAASSGGHNMIASNNPNASRALFRVPINDICNPVASAFVKLDRATMVQTIKFNPYDNLRFSVYLPNGELFITDPNTQRIGSISPTGEEGVDGSDNYSPLPPDPDVQISAVFCINRID